MTNYREKMLKKTANLRSVADITETPPKDGKPKTAPGMMGALAEANLRIQELEKQSAQSLELSLDSISPNPWQPRKEFNAEELDELASSIKEIGLIQPIVVRVDPTESQKYQIVVGERRFRAHQLIGRETIKALITDLDDQLMAVWALGENITRADLSDFEISKAARTVENEFPSRKALAEALGMSRQHLYRYFSFEQMPDFVRADLEARPRLMSCSTAERLQVIFGQAGIETALPIFKELWQTLKEGELDQAKLPALLKQRLDSPLRTPTQTNALLPLYTKGRKAGHVKKDATAFVIKIQAKYLTPEQEQKLRDAVGEIFPT